MTDLYYANSLHFRDNITLEDLLLEIPEPAWERAFRYHFPRDAYNYALGRIMLKHLLLKRGYPENILEKITYNAEKKPMLEGIYFNISHSADLVACAVSTGPVGLDIEIPAPQEFSDFSHVFTPEEWDEIKYSKDPQETFYWYWTAKESILKANGFGLAHLEEIYFVASRTAYFGIQKNVWQLQSLDIIEGCYATLCSKKVGEVKIEEFVFRDDLFGS